MKTLNKFFAITLVATIVGSASAEENMKSVEETLETNDIFKISQQSTYKLVDASGTWGSKPVLVNKDGFACEIFVDPSLSGQTLAFDYLREVKVKSAQRNEIPVKGSDIPQIEVVYELTDIAQESVLRKIVCKSQVGISVSPQTPTIEELAKLFGNGVDLGVRSAKARPSKTADSSSQDAPVVDAHI